MLCGEVACLARKRDRAESASFAAWAAGPKARAKGQQLAVDPLKVGEDFGKAREQLLLLPHAVAG